MLPDMTRAHDARTLLARAAASVDADPRLLPCFDALFAGIDSLGGSPRMVAGLLAREAVGERDRVLDVGCGKGAAAVEVARRLRCTVVGIDALPVFLTSAEALAARRGVADLVEFVRADARRWKPRQRFDAALFLGIAPVEDVAGWIPRLVRPGAVVVIDDAVAVSADCRHGVPSLEEARAVLESVASIRREIVWTPSRSRRLNESLLRRLARNAASIANARPDRRRLLREFLARQRRASRVLSGPIRPVFWVAHARG